MAMTPEEALLKLLALEPERRDRIQQITGWPVAVTDDALDRLEAEGRVGWRQAVNGNCRNFREYFLRPTH